MSDRMRRLSLLICSQLVLAALCSGMALASDEELLDLVRAGMYHRYTSITTCKGALHLVATRPAPDDPSQEKRMFERTITVAFDGNRLRISGKAMSDADVNYQEAFDGEKTTEFIDPGIADATSTARITAGSTGIGSGDFAVFVDPRSIGGLPLKTLEGDVDGSMKVVGREVLGGENCVVLEVTSNPLASAGGGHMTGKLWVAMDKGCAVPQASWAFVRSGSSTPIPMREETAAFRQCGDGLWAPTAYTRVDYHPDGTIEKKVIGTYDLDFGINVSVGEEDVRLTLPSGTSVYDQRIGAAYTTP